MYQEDEDDWQILKEYKKERKIKLNEKIKDYKKVKNKVQRKVPATEKEIEALKKKIEADEAARAQSNSIAAGTGGAVSQRTILESDKDIAALEKNTQYLKDLQDDIETADKGIKEFEAEVQQLNAEIARIEQKIKEIRAKKTAEKERAKAAGEDEPVEKCKKKCRITDVTLSCKHQKDRKFKLEVPPLESSGGEVPQLHVISGSKFDTWDEVTVNYGGACGFGRTNSAPDTGEVKKLVRVEGGDNYCPRTQIKNNVTGVTVDRPSGVVFAPIVPVSIVTHPVQLLFKQLCANPEQERQTYDLTFISCQGTLPYKAQVHAYLSFEWSLSASFGYKSAVGEKKLDVTKKVTKTETKVTSYDGIEAKGAWEALIKWEYVSDGRKLADEHKWSISEFANAIGKQWKVLSAFQTFFDPLSGFFEQSLLNDTGYLKQSKLDKQEREAKRKGQDNKKSDGQRSISVEWPNIIVKGGYKRVELPGKHEIGGEGNFSFGFDPLFGITGKIELMPYILSTLGGPFGAFLNRVANMSIGEEGKGSYAATDLSLTISATAKVSGVVAFKCTAAEGWNIDDNGSGIAGIIGFELAGKVGAKGKVWIVKFECGAMFKTTDESGGKPAGIEVSLKPAVMAGKFNMVGEMLFNGLAIVYALYANGGIEGAAKEKGKKRKKIKGYSTSKDPEITQANDLKSEITEKVVLFKPRPLFKTDTVTIDG